MNNKHSLILLLTVLLVSGMLVACGAKEPAASTAEPPKPTAAATETPVYTPTPSADELLAMGIDYLEQDQFEQAVAALQEALHLDAGDANIHYNLALTYYYLGQLDEAIAGYAEAVRLNPDHADAYYNLGRAYYEQDKLDEAISAWQESIRIEPDDSMVHNNVGRAYFDQGRFDEATVELKEAIALDAANPLAHFNLGLVYLEQGMTGDATTELETYLELIPSDDPNRAMIEQEIARLKGEPAEYRNAAAGYAFPYPGDLSYAQDGTAAVFSTSQAAVDAVMDDAWAKALQEAPSAMFDASSLDEMAEAYDLAVSASPVEYLQATAQDLGANTGEVETGNLQGYPAALIQILGDFEGTSYIGVMGIAIVDERVIAATAIAQPDQWDTFGPTFMGMFNKLSFFEPER